MDLDNLKLKSKNAYRNNAKRKYNLNDIIKNINKMFIDNNDVLKEMIDIDSEKWGMEISFDKMIDIVKENENDNTSKYFKDNSGSIIYKFPEHPYITIELAINAIKTHNSIIFITDDNFLMVNTVLVKLISIAVSELDLDENTVLLSNIRDLDYIEE